MVLHGTAPTELAGREGFEPSRIAFGERPAPRAPTYSWMGHGQFPCVHGGVLRSAAAGYPSQAPLFLVRLSTDWGATPWRAAYLNYQTSVGYARSRTGQPEGNWFTASRGSRASIVPRV